MKKSVASADFGHERDFVILKEGMTELELANEMEAVLRRR